MGDLLIVGSEATNHHVQIFDLRKLLEITAEEKPKVFDSIQDLASLWKGLPVGRTHNIVVNQELQYFVSVGSNPTRSDFYGGLVFVDVHNPSNPPLLGFQAQDGYVHEQV